MNYRSYKPEDYSKVNELCVNYGIKFPSDNMFLFVAENNGEIIGICGALQVIQIEPLICNNPVVANNLVKMVEGVLIANKTPFVTAYVDKSNEKHLNQLEKYGFEITETEKIILEKRYG